MSNNIVQLNQSNFEKEVINSNIPVIVDFWAAWCGPCRMIAPIIEQLSVEYLEKVKVAKLNVDENPDLAGQYGINSIPAIYMFKNGQKVDALIGARPKQAFDDMIKRNI